MFKQLCCSKYRQELSEHELQSIQQEVNDAKSFDLAYISLSKFEFKFLDTIDDSAVKDKLFKEYYHVAQKARDEILKLCVRLAEKLRDEHRDSFNVGIKHMWSYRNLAPADEKIPFVMIQLIEQRCQKISERIQCIYKLKKMKTAYSDNDEYLFLIKNFE